MRLRPALLAIIVGLLPHLSSAATAQTDFPNKPVRIIVPYAPGGLVDVAMRRLGDLLSKRWGVSVVTENRAGGGTIPATAMLAKADADGYTLGVATSPFLVNPTLHKNLPYDSVRDFTGVSMVVSQSVTLIAHPSFPANSLAEFLANAKQSREPLAYGSAGTGGIAHLTGEMFQRAAGIKLTHIPYPGVAKTLNDIVAGQISLAFEPGFSSRPFVEAGRLKVLGVTSKARLPILPDVATIAEMFPGFEVYSIQALIAPAGVPAEVLEKLSADVQVVVKSPEFAAQVSPLDLEPTASTPEEFNAFARREMARWKEVIELAKIGER